MLNEMTKQNALKFAMFFGIGNSSNFFHFSVYATLSTQFLKNLPWLVLKYFKIVAH